MVLGKLGIHIQNKEAKSSPNTIQKNQKNPQSEPKTEIQRRTKNPDNTGFSNDSLSKTPDTQVTASKIGIVTHTCDPITQEAEARVQTQLGQPIEFEASQKAMQ